MLMNDIRRYLFSCFSDTPNVRYLERYREGFFTDLNEEIKRLPVKLSYLQECAAFKCAFRKALFFADVNGLSNGIRGESREVMEKLLNMFSYGMLGD